MCTGLQSQVALRPANAAMLLHTDYTWYICTAYLLLHLHRLPEAHEADTEAQGSAIWCMQFVMLTSSVVCAF